LDGKLYVDSKEAKNILYPSTDEIRQFSNFTIEHRTPKKPFYTVEKTLP